MEMSRFARAYFLPIIASLCLTLCGTVTPIYAQVAATTSPAPAIPSDINRSISLRELLPHDEYFSPRNHR